MWESAADTAPLVRALALAGAAGAPQLSVADLSIGQRDAYLLALRQECFGSSLACVVDCPECGAELEMDLSIADVAVNASPPDRATVTAEGADIELRAVTSRDLRTVADRPAARRELIQRCITCAPPGHIESLSESVLDQLSAAMSSLDPQADVYVQIDCAVCDHRWAAPFDIASYLWSELHTHALRILRDVHELASLYGWSEAEVLAVSPSRRRRYLEMATP